MRQAFAYLFLVVGTANSFTPKAELRQSLSQIAVAEEDDAPPQAEYGVSYIGGDPCGSKYNDDPFDVQVQKPGMPDDMKARIQALVDKKVAEEAAREAEESSN